MEGRDSWYETTYGWSYLSPEQYGDQPSPKEIRGPEFSKKYPNFTQFKYDCIFYYIDPDQTGFVPEAVLAMINQNQYTVRCDLLARLEGNKRPGVCMMY